MPQANPAQLAQAVAEALKQVEKNYYQIDERVQQFCQTCEGQLQQLSSSLQKVEQEGQNFEGDVDQSLKQLEQEAVQNQGVWAVLAPGNKYAKKEQVSQKRLALLNMAKKLRQTMQEASSELGVTVKQFQDDTRQLQKDFTPIKQDFQTLAKNLDQLHNNLKAQQGQGVMGSQGTMPAQSPQGQGGGQTGALPPQPQAGNMPGQKLSPRDRQILTGLQQAMGELSLAQQLLEHNKVLFQVLKTFDSHLEQTWQYQ